MSQLINNLGGIEVFGIISICLFFTVFTTSMIWACCLKKSFLRSMESLPLEDERQPVNPPTTENV